MAVVFRMFAHQWYLINRPDLDDRESPTLGPIWPMSKKPDMSRRIEVISLSGGPTSITGILENEADEGKTCLVSDTCATEWDLLSEYSRGWRYA